MCHLIDPQLIWKIYPNCRINVNWFDPKNMEVQGGNQKLLRVKKILDLQF